MLNVTYTECHYDECRGASHRHTPTSDKGPANQDLSNAFIYPLSLSFFLNLYSFSVCLNTFVSLSLSLFLSSSLSTCHYVSFVSVSSSASLSCVSLYVFLSSLHALSLFISLFLSLSLALRHSAYRHSV